MKLRKSKKNLEIAWLVAAILSAATFIHALISKGINESIPFFIIFVLSLLIYLLRRDLRRKNSSSKE